MPDKKQVEELIAKLGTEREILYRCNRVWEAWNIGTMTESDFEEVESEVLIGDVLEKMKNDIEIEIITKDNWGIDVGSYDVAKLMNLWGVCGFTRSLQVIIEASGWEDGYDDDKSKTNAYPKQLKDPDARALLEFIGELNLTN